MYKTFKTTYVGNVPTTRVCLRVFGAGRMRLWTARRVAPSRTHRYRLIALRRRRRRRLTPAIIKITGVRRHTLVSITTVVDDSFSLFFSFIFRPTSA